MSRTVAQWHSGTAETDWHSRYIVNVHGNNFSIKITKLQTPLDYTTLLSVFVCAHK